MTISEAVAAYVNQKREYGRDYCKVAQILNSFAAQIGHMELTAVRARHVAAFLNRKPNLSRTWYHKYMRLRGLFRYWVAHGELSRVPLPHKRAEGRTDFYPHIYSRTQIWRLLAKTGAALRTPSCAIDRTTMVALLLFLYGTGLTVGEALGAKREHLDLKQSSLRVAGVSSRPNRILPLGADVKALLEWHLKISLTGPETNRPLFATKNADSINHRTLAITFRRLCTLAKVSRRLDARYQPRLHDFRHTFAVHRIVRWFREGADVRKMLPLLAAFMGMVTVTATDGYLLLAPARYRKQIRRVG